MKKLTRQESLDVACKVVENAECNRFESVMLEAGWKKASVKIPPQDTDLFYYFEPIGVHDGRFLGIDEPTGWYIFGCPYGFITEPANEVWWILNSELIP